jgi:hypothetical protein
VALDVELEDGRMGDEPVHGGERHCGVREDPVPLTEGLVGGNQDGTALVTCAEQFEEHAGFGLVLGDVGEVIEVEAEQRGVQWTARQPTAGGTCRAWR